MAIGRTPSSVNPAEAGGGSMRTNIVIDDALMARALRATGLATKRAVVEAGLRLLIQVRGQRGIRGLRGRVKWGGNLDEMRGGRLGGE